MRRIPDYYLRVSLPLFLSCVVFATSLAVGEPAAIFWLVGLGCLVVAGVNALRLTTKMSVKRTILIVTAFMVAGAVGARIALMAAVAIPTAGVPNELSLDARAVTAAQSVVHSKVQQKMTLDQAARKASEERIQATLLTMQSASSESPSRTEAWADAAKRAGYVPRSGLQQEFSQATATLVGGTVFVTVPMRGTNLADMTKVVYAVEGKKTTTFEYAAGVVDPSHAQLGVWVDGTQTMNVEIYDPAQDASGTTAGSAGDSATALNVGFSWSKLNRCLLNAGISQWALATLGIICGVACAVTLGAGCAICIAAATGLASGTVTACVIRART